MTFRIRNTEITLRFGFIAVLALLLTLDGGQYVLPAILSCTVHESGHILAAWLCGMHLESICFGALGIHMAGNMASVSHLRRSVISLAGPLTNFLCFFLFLPLPMEYRAVQLVLFVFHILPAVPLDGGTALYSLLCSVMPEERAAHWCTILSIVFALLLGTLGFSILLQSRYNFSLLFAALYILLYIALKQRGNLC